MYLSLFVLGVIRLLFRCLAKRDAFRSKTLAMNIHCRSYRTRIKSAVLKLQKWHVVDVAPPSRVKSVNDPDVAADVLNLVPTNVHRSVFLHYRRGAEIIVVTIERFCNRWRR